MADEEVPAEGWQEMIGIGEERGAKTGCAVVDARRGTPATDIVPRRTIREYVPRSAIESPALRKSSVLFSPFEPTNDSDGSRWRTFWLMTGLNVDNGV